jgi:HAD superfamily hydrolase (TIGR01490 family)
MAEIIAVFDLEGTLCQGGRLIWHELVKRRSKQVGGIFRVASHIIFGIIMRFLRKWRLIGEYKARSTGVGNMATLLGGLEVTEVDQLAEDIAQKVVATLRSDIQKILNEHKERGHKVILASSLFQPLLEAIGRRLGISLILGTGLEVKGSKYTGKVSTAICFDNHRVSMLRDFTRGNGLEVDFAQSYAYGDTKWDKPVLEMVGNPVAVYPDSELRAYAQSKGWKIIG